MNADAFDPSPEVVNRLYRAAWALCGSSDGAEDLMQETFARVLARPRLLHCGDPVTYLRRALRNTYLTSLRTASRRPQTTELPVEGSSVMESRLARPDAVIEQRELLEAIADLRPDSRATLVAVDLVGLSHAEVATALGVRAATIGTRLFRARQRLAERLGWRPL